jgi:hypothetical protein
VDLRLRRRLAAPLWAWQHHQGPRRSSRRAHLLSRCGGLREMGWQRAAQRGRMGIRRARRARRRRVHLGRCFRAEREADGEHLAGRVSLAEPAQGRLRGHLAGAYRPTATASTT